MGKIRQNGRESKKQAILTPKEKKAVRRAKKHVAEVAPIIPQSV